MTFEPKIIALCCNYCAYTAADLAGSTRLKYPTNVTIVRLPCSGKADVIHMLKAFGDGADGVYVAGCREGDCHFIRGNLRAKKRVAYAKQLLQEAGVNPDRLEMFNLSAAEGPRFAEIATEMTERIRTLGPCEVATHVPAQPKPSVPSVEGEKKSPPRSETKKEEAKA